MNQSISDTDKQIYVVGDFITDIYLEAYEVKANPETKTGKVYQYAKDGVMTCAGGAGAVASVLWGYNTEAVLISASTKRPVPPPNKYFHNWLTNDKTCNVFKTRHLLDTGNGLELLPDRWDFEEVETWTFAPSELAENVVKVLAHYNKGLVPIKGHWNYIDPAPGWLWGNYGTWDCLKCNHLEALQQAKFLGIPNKGSETETFHKLAKAYAERGPIAITCGPCSIVYIDEKADSTLLIPVPEVTSNVTDITGAGDTFFATLIYAREIRKYSVAESLRYASIAATYQIQNGFGIQPVPLSKVFR